MKFIEQLPKENHPDPYNDLQHGESLEESENNENQLSVSDNNDK